MHVDRKAGAVKRHAILLEPADSGVVNLKAARRAIIHEGIQGHAVLRAIQRRVGHVEQGDVLNFAARIVVSDTLEAVIGIADSPAVDRQILDHHIACIMHVDHGLVDRRSSVGYAKSGR